MAVKDQIRDFIRTELILDAQETRVEDDTPLLDEALIDSLGVFKLAAYVEGQFGIEIHDAEMVPEHFGSVEALARLVETKRGEKGPSG